MKMVCMSPGKKTKSTLFGEKSYEKLVQKKDCRNDENFVFLPGRITGFRPGQSPCEVPGEVQKGVS